MINFDKVRSCVQDITNIVSEVGAEFGAGASKEALKNAVEAKVSERDLFGDVSEDCRNESKGEYDFICSRCGACLPNKIIGYSYVDDEGIRWYGTSTKQEREINYCPHC